MKLHLVQKKIGASYFGVEMFCDISIISMKNVHGIREISIAEGNFGNTSLSKKTMASGLFLQ